MSIKCPYCGFENPDTSSFCGNCAQNTLDGYNTKDAKIQRIQKNHQLNDVKKLQVSGCFVILGILFFFGLILYISSKEVSKNTSSKDNAAIDTVAKNINVQQFGLPTVDYIYSVGMTEDPDTGKVDLNVYTKNKRFKFQAENGTLRSKSVFVKFDLYAGITDSGEVFTVNEDYIKIGETKYDYEGSLKHLLSMSEILTVAVDDLYVWFFTGELTVMSAKRNEIQKNLKYENLRTIAQLGTVYGVYYIPGKRVMYATNGRSIYRLEIGKRDKFEFSDIKEYAFENNEEAVIALATYGNSFVYITRNYNDKSQNLYVTTVKEMDSLFR